MAVAISVALIVALMLWEIISSYRRLGRLKVRAVPDVRRYTYRIVWMDDQFVATVDEFPSLSWCHDEQVEALNGLVKLVSGVVADLEANGEPVPE